MRGVKLTAMMKVILKTLAEKRLVWRLALTLWILAILIYAVKVWLKTDYSDFNVYYSVSQRFLRADWFHIYDAEIDGSTPLRYAPPTIWVFAPLALFSHQWARELWFIMQAVAFSVGFGFLLKTLRASVALRVTADFYFGLTMLFALRYVLDSYTNGQSSSLMFLCSCIGVWHLVKKQWFWVGFWFAWPAVMKLGPGTVFVYLALVHFKESKQWLKGAIVSTAASQLITSLVVAVIELKVGQWSPVSAFVTLWQRWVNIVSTDAQYALGYTDHYGNQALKGSLLRLAKLGWWSADAVRAYYSVIVVGVLLAVAIFWFLVSRKNWVRQKFNESVTLVRSAGIATLSYLILMPQTWKYSMPYLAIPFMAWLMLPWRLGDRVVFVLFLVVFPLGGLDVVGETLFAWIQHASLPSLGMCWLILRLMGSEVRLSAT